MNIADMKPTSREFSVPGRKSIPTLPRELFAPSALGTAGFLLYSFMLFAVPGVIGYLVSQSSLILPMKCVLIAFTSMVAGWGLFALASATHEGFHYTLHKNRVVSSLIGLFASSAVPGFFGTGFFVYHWNHHRYTNTSLDPDCTHFSEYKTLFSRLIFVRLTTNLRYAEYSARMALGHLDHFKYVSPIKPRHLQLYSIFNFICQSFWLSCYFAVFLYSSELFLCMVLLPTVWVLAITGITPYLEHADTELEVGKNSRSRTSGLFTLLQIGTNYHNEHHMYPAIPCWRLPKVHKLLNAQGYYKTNNIPDESNFFHGFRFARARYAYTKGFDI
jgi:fatty acid desaturase